jgi:hypothetical protein
LHLPEWRARGAAITFVLDMYEFTQLLIRASQTLGTVLGVANLLEVDPRLVYRWIAGFESPEPASVEIFVLRLRAMYEAPVREPAHPNRRRFDERVTA